MRVNTSDQFSSERLIVLSADDMDCILSALSNTVRAIVETTDGQRGKALEHLGRIDGIVEEMRGRFDL